MTGSESKWSVETVLAPLGKEGGEARQIRNTKISRCASGTLAHNEIIFVHRKVHTRKITSYPGNATFALGNVRLALSDFHFGRRPTPQISHTASNKSNTSHQRRTTLRAAPSTKRNAAGKSRNKIASTIKSAQTCRKARRRGFIIFDFPVRTMASLLLPRRHYRRRRREKVHPIFPQFPIG